MDTILNIVQICLFMLGMICYIITNIKTYRKRKLKEAQEIKSKEEAKAKLFEMYKKYFKENQNVEQPKTTTQTIKELEETQGE